MCTSGDFFNIDILEGKQIRTSGNLSFVFFGLFRELSSVKSLAL